MLRKRDPCKRAAGRVESRRPATVGPAYLLPPLSFGGASLAGPKRGRIYLLRTPRGVKSHFPGSSGSAKWRPHLPRGRLFGGGHRDLRVALYRRAGMNDCLFNHLFAYDKYVEKIRAHER
ncbi:hypothetical protein THIOKS12350002 [Thiocapsa sp. KS1]|nr:hypothetical protein THIOKS12350002 [Thiocapsa sp. KS1]